MTSSFPDAPPGLPAVTTEQMREVDRLMVDEYGIVLLQMMENAGRALAVLARARFLAGAVAERVVVLAGRGGNGGGGIVAARRLAGWGADVAIVLATARERLTDVPRHQLVAAERMGLAITEDGGLPEADLIIDALIGYSLHGAPAGRTAELIRGATASQTPVLSLDVPSGLDAGSGEVFDPVVRATATLTLALPKTGLSLPATSPYVGELYVADIGVPPALYAEPTLGLDVGQPFAASDILRVR